MAWAGVGTSGADPLLGYLPHAGDALLPARTATAGEPDVTMLPVDFNLISPPRLCREHGSCCSKAAIYSSPLKLGGLRSKARCGVGKERAL